MARCGRRGHSSILHQAIALVARYGTPLSAVTLRRLSAACPDGLSPSRATKAWGRMKHHISAKNSRGKNLWREAPDAGMRETEIKKTAWPDARGEKKEVVI